jgi:hypothetical protein
MRTQLLALLASFHLVACVTDDDERTDDRFEDLIPVDELPEIEADEPVAGRLPDLPAMEIDGTYVDASDLEVAVPPARQATRPNGSWQQLEQR